jgi:hypothetical protein
MTGKWSLSVSAKVASATGVLLALFAVSQASAASPSKAALKDGRDSFDIELPSACQLTTKGRGIDFQVFYVICGGVDYAGVYVGNAADNSTPRSRLLMTEFDWPAEVQVWSDVVTGHQDEADKIAASVRLKSSSLRQN